jgi:hypothetical protein
VALSVTHASCLLLRVTESAIELRLEIGPVSYLSVGRTGAIGGSWAAAVAPAPVEPCLAFAGQQPGPRRALSESLRP